MLSIRLPSKIKEQHRSMLQDSAVAEALGRRAELARIRSANDQRVAELTAKAEASGTEVGIVAAPEHAVESELDSLHERRGDQAVRPIRDFWEANKHGVDSGPGEGSSALAFCISAAYAAGLEKAKAK
jgi:hypothetical protein